MKVLVGNYHNSQFGGGEYYTYQCSKAISEFAEILFLQEPNKNLLNGNLELKHKYRIWNNREKVDVYLNISHFSTNICNTAERNIHVSFFPNESHKIEEYYEVVTICDFGRFHANRVWGIDSNVIQPYSKDFTPQKKRPNSIVCIGNLFKEADGHSKHQYKLIEALSLLEDSNYTLDVLGAVVTPEYASECESIAKGKNVNFYFNVSEAKKKELIESAEFCWHANGYGRDNPYQTEHFGIAMVEALKAGCKTYVHNSGGAKDFCKSWNSLSELVRMTKNNVPNNDKLIFQTPENMTKQWKDVLCKEEES